MNLVSLDTTLAQLKLKYLRTKFPYREYSHKHKVIFIHIPKTAGTSVLKILMGKKIRRDHLSYSVYQKAQSKIFNNYFKFCFVRNPYDRLVSAFEYLKNGGNQNGDLYFKELIENHYPTFEEFVLGFLNKDNVNSILLLRPQYLFVCDEKFEIMVDFCGRFENIERDINVVCEKVGIDKKLEKTNASNKKNHQYYYFNEKVKKKVYEIYSKDFEIFGYSK